MLNKMLSKSESFSCSNSLRLLIRHLVLMGGKHLRVAAVALQGWVSLLLPRMAQCFWSSATTPRFRYRSFRNCPRLSDRSGSTSSTRPDWRRFQGPHLFYIRHADDKRDRPFSVFSWWFIFRYDVVSRQIITYVDLLSGHTHLLNKKLFLLRWSWSVLW